MARWRSVRGVRRNRSVTPRDEQEVIDDDYTKTIAALDVRVLAREYRGTGRQSRNGLEAQREAIATEAERRGWDVEYFADEGASGKYINGNLREVLHLLASGQGDGLIVAKLDRLARSVVHADNIIQGAQAQGWSLVVLDLNLDLTTAAGRMMARAVRSVRPIRARADQ